MCFVDLTFFGRSGEIAHQYLKKGSKVMIEGRLSFDQWSDDKGQKHSKHSVIVETMQMVDSKNNGVSGDNAYNTPPKNNSYNHPDTSNMASKAAVDDIASFDEIKEDEIPF